MIFINYSIPSQVSICRPDQLVDCAARLNEFRISVFGNYWFLIYLFNDHQIEKQYWLEHGDTKEGMHTILALFHTNYYRRINNIKSYIKPKKEATTSYFVRQRFDACLSALHRSSVNTTYRTLGLLVCSQPSHDMDYTEYTLNLG